MLLCFTATCLFSALGDFDVTEEEINEVKPMYDRKNIPAKTNFILDFMMFSLVTDSMKEN